MMKDAASAYAVTPLLRRTQREVFMLREVDGQNTAIPLTSCRSAKMW